MQYVDQTIRTLETYIKPQGVNILSLLGLYYATSTALSALRSFSRTFLLFPHNLPQRYGAGSWALITGGAGGLGAAFAERLAGLGFNIILIDKDEINIAATALTIEGKFSKIQVKTIVTDFTKSFEPGFYDNLLKDVEDLDISILVNNVGTGGGFGSFAKIPEDAILRGLAVNVGTMTILSRRLIPKMLQRSNRSAIINLSSYVYLRPMSFIPIYSSTKAYVDTLSRMIEEDVRHKIDVITARPHVVSTALAGNPEVGGYVISPAVAIDAILGKVGRTPYAHGHWKHETVCWLSRSDWFTKYVILRQPRKTTPKPAEKAASTQERP